MDDETLEAYAVGALRLAATQGDEQKGCFLAGQIAGMVKREQSAREIIDEILEQAVKVLCSMGKVAD